MNRILIILALVLSAIGSFGQNAPVNLVPNGGFELHNPCPNSVADLNHCQDWEAFIGTPDYFNQCATSIVGTPSNIFGFQEATDQGYIGLYGYSSSFSGGEIAWTILSSPLITGVNYRVRFKASYADSANYAICCLGMILSNTPPTSGPYNANLSSVELVLQENEFDTTSWFQVDQVYTAQGGEDRVYLGTFRREDEMNPILVRPNGSSAYNRAYFYIDDIEVYEDDLVGLNEDEPSVSLVSQVVSNKLDITTDRPLTLNVFDMSGRQMLFDQLAQGSNQVDVSALKSGIYLAVFSDAKGARHTEKVLVQR